MRSERKSRRKFLRWSALAAVGALAGCAPQAPPTPQVIEKTVIVEGTPQIVRETVVVQKEKVQLLYVERGGDPTGTLFTQMTEAFNNKQGHIYVTYQPVAGDIWEKVQALYASGRPPDVHYSLDATADLAAGGMILPLDPFIENDPTFDVEDYYEEHLINARYDGKLWALNWSVAPVVMYSNLTLYEKAGLEPPKPDYTWGDARAIAGALTKKDETWGWGPQSALDFMQHIWQAGWEMWTDDFSRSTLDEPEVIEAVQFWADMVLKDGYCPDPEQQGGRESLELFQTGKVANYADGVWRLAAAKDWDFDWQIYYHPKKKVARGINWCSYNAISAQTKYLDECWEFLKYWSSPEWQFKYNKTFMYIAPPRSVNEMKPFVNPDLPDVNWDLYLIAAEQGHRPPVCPRGNEVVWTIAGNAFDEIVRGKKTAKEALTEAAPKATELLKMGFGLETAH